MKLNSDVGYNIGVGRLFSLVTLCHFQKKQYARARASTAVQCTAHFAITSIADEVVIVFKPSNSLFDVYGLIGDITFGVVVKKKKKIMFGCSKVQVTSLVAVQRISL